ncbi:MAG: hypothetical protein GX442_00255 [Candidatus Riflebacteria bacterium]|nr:hypothetical protein [Candidatus Riflebacteria bacterium]
MKLPLIVLIVLASLAGVILFAQTQNPNQPAPAMESDGVASSPAPATTPTPAPGGSRSALAMKDAAAAGKILFVFFHEGTASAPSEIQTRFEGLMAREGASAAWIVIDRQDSAEQDLVSKYQIQRAPMPLILAMAPNGAITAGFPGDKLSETTIREAFVSKGMQSCLAPLQQGKLVVLSLQNAKTSGNEAATAGAREFAADPQLAAMTEIVSCDPADPAEVSMLEKMRLTGSDTEARTILLAPPGMVIGQFKGAVTKADLLGALQAATSGGCGSGGCGPRGCGPSGCAP